MENEPKLENSKQKQTCAEKHLRTFKHPQDPSVCFPWPPLPPKKHKDPHQKNMKKPGVLVNLQDWPNDPNFNRPGSLALFGTIHLKGRNTWRWTLRMRGTSHPGPTTKEPSKHSGARAEVATAAKPGEMPQETTSKT